MCTGIKLIDWLACPLVHLSIDRLIDIMTNLSALETAYYTRPSLSGRQPGRPCVRLCSDLQGDVSPSRKSRWFELTRRQIMIRAQRQRFTSARAVNARRCERAPANRRPSSVAFSRPFARRSGDIYTRARRSPRWKPRSIGRTETVLDC